MKSAHQNDLKTQKYIYLKYKIINKSNFDQKPVRSQCQTSSKTIDVKQPATFIFAGTYKDHVNNLWT